MFELRACKPDHVAAVRVQDAQREEHRLAIEHGTLAVVERGLSFAGFVNGRCVGAAGVVDGYAWAALSPEVGPYMVTVTRLAKRVLAVQPYRILRTTVRRDFTAGHRWIKHLGFVLQCRQDDGYDLYVRECG